jgi:bifunctional DNA-binding transcriptional regulator/antitoxin component of YhaV-PrlF toxin-antitoxin module
MSTTTTIDAAGRLVIPEALRQRYGFEPGRGIELVPGELGVTLIPERPKRRFVRHGAITALDTGVGVAMESEFDLATLRDQHLEEKSGAHWR